LKSDLIKFDIKTLSVNKSKLKKKDPSLINAYKQLIVIADKSLKFKPVSVMDKKDFPPSGNKHDYMSIAPYWWPNPAKPNGIPYIKKDGEVNPEVANYTDKENFPKLIENIYNLCIAYYFSENEIYASHASELLEVWFLDTATKMNPNLNFGQAVKGVISGRAEGLIDTRHFIYLLDAIELLKGSKSWTSTNQTELKKWFSEFHNWMQTSKIGINEMNAKNNHGIWYDAQVVSLQLYLGKVSEAKEYITNNTLKRIPVQIEADGKMPLELVRTAAMSYNNFCLEAWFKTATLADKAGIDIWHYSTADGKNIRLAFEWFLPYAMGEKKWEYKQIHDYKRNKLYYLLLLASNHYNEPKYYEAAQKIKKEAGNTIIDLFYDK